MCPGSAGRGTGLQSARRGFPCMSTSRAAAVRLTQGRPLAGASIVPDARGCQMVGRPGPR